jgi:molecular chaperone DnaK
MEAVKKANEGTDAAAIQQALDQLNAAQHKAAEALYKQQAPGGPAGSGPSDGAGSGSSAGGSSGSRPAGDVIDAEVVDEGKQ